MCEVSRFQKKMSFKFSFECYEVHILNIIGRLFQSRGIEPNAAIPQSLM